MLKWAGNKSLFCWQKYHTFNLMVTSDLDILFVRDYIILSDQVNSSYLHITEPTYKFLTVCKNMIIAHYLNFLSLVLTITSRPEKQTYRMVHIKDYLLSKSYFKLPENTNRRPINSSIDIFWHIYFFLDPDFPRIRKARDGFYQLPLFSRIGHSKQNNIISLTCL